MKPVQFLSNSTHVSQIIKGLTLTKSLLVSSIVVGEAYTGKKSLVESIFPRSIFVDGSNSDALSQLLQSNEELIIYNFEAVSDISRYDFNNRRIVAIANSSEAISSLEEKFAFMYHMPSLKDRPEDISMLVEHFKNSICEELMITGDAKIDETTLDFSENIKSLKASIYRQLVTSNLTKDELESLLFAYLLDKINGNNAYREHLGLFERPLIKAGLKQYKSQLKLSSVLGLNRNTLRKKIHEHNID